MHSIDRKSNLNSSIRRLAPLWEVGPLILQPSLRLGDFGYDNNPYSRTRGQLPVSDVTGTASPALDSWLRLPHVQMRAHGDLYFYYFRDQSNLRARDENVNAEVSFPLNRLIPFVRGYVNNLRQPQSFEVEGIAGVRQDGFSAGVNVRLTPKTTIGVYQERSQVEFDQNSFYFGTDLARTLNHSSEGEGILASYALTPYTVVGVDANQRRDRFDTATVNDSDNTEVTPFFEFSPSAVISGRASFGVQRRKFRVGAIQDVSGTTMNVALNYVLLGQTRFSVDVRRRLRYSYVVLVRQYEDTEYTLTVTQRLGESWDVTGTIGRALVGYRDGGAPPLPGVAPIPDEDVRIADLDLGYNIGSSRAGLRMEYRARSVAVPDPAREYSRFRVGANLIYYF